MSAPSTSPRFSEELSTPLLRSRGGLRLKAECLQPGGSYKVRGVRRFFSAASRKGELSRLHNVSTVSAGNLGRALAEEAARRSIPCEIIVPDTTPLNKKEKILSLGATLTLRPFAEIFSLVENPPPRENFLHPLLTPELLAGYGTIAEEILRASPDTELIVVPFGLGGLALGIARALEQLKPSARVVAAELDLCAPFRAALNAGTPVKIEQKSRSFVDAIGTPFVLPYVFAEARVLLAGSVTVTIEETRRALLQLYLDHALKVEGAAAVAFAAGEKLADLCPGAKIAVVLSGANIDADVFTRETATALSEVRERPSLTLPSPPPA
jgi:threonine dehydratase